MIYNVKKKDNECSIQNQVIHQTPTGQAIEREWDFTPADDVVELHPAILTDVDWHNFAPEQQALDQHPREGSHEEKVE